MRMETKDPLNAAAGIVSDRIRALPEFVEARKAVVSGVADEIAGLDVPAMIALGGISQVVARHIEGLSDRYREDHGSQMWPWTIVDELGLLKGELRMDAQMMATRQGGRR